MVIPNSESIGTGSKDSIPGAGFHRVQVDTFGKAPYRDVQGTWRARRTNRALSTQKDASMCRACMVAPKNEFHSVRALLLLSCFVVPNLFANFFGIFI